MSDLNLDDLKAKAEAATPGEWTHPDCRANRDSVCVGDLIVADTQIDDENGDLDWRQGEANAAFIAAANPQTVLQLIAEIERLHALLDAARAAANVL